MRDVIIKPIITEKSMKNAANGKFTFVVATSATKEVIKIAVEKLFNVHVVTVATIVVKGKSLRVGKRRIVKNLSALKKAIVELRKGEKIDLFEAVA